MDLKIGAKPLKRAIQTEIEDTSAEEILAHNMKSGDKVTVVVHDKKVTFTVKDYYLPNLKNKV